MIIQSVLHAMMGGLLMLMVFVRVSLLHYSNTAMNGNTIEIKNELILIETMTALECIPAVPYTNECKYMPKILK